MLDEILRILEDGDWHRFAEIMDKIQISEGKVVNVVKFLNEYGLAQFDSDEKKVRLSPDFLELPV